VDTPASPTELTRAREVEDTTVLASAHEDAEGLVQKVALLKGELAEARQAREVAEKKFCSLFDASADGARWLCLDIVGPSRVRNQLSERMRPATICHIKMVGEHVVLRVTVTSVVELVLGRSPDETF
jgi:hypothetical protein